MYFWMLLKAWRKWEAMSDLRFSDMLLKPSALKRIWFQVKFFLRTVVIIALRHSFPFYFALEVCTEGKLTGANFAPRYFWEIQEKFLSRCVCSTPAHLHCPRKMGSGFFADCLSRLPGVIAMVPRARQTSLPPCQPELGGSSMWVRAPPAVCITHTSISPDHFLGAAYRGLCVCVCVCLYVYGCVPSYPRFCSPHLFKDILIANSPPST